MTTQTATSRTYLNGIEALRAYAALLIVIFHLIHIVDFTPPGLLEYLKWNAGFGVPLFFCISAFSLAYGYSGKLNDMQQIKWFYIRRLFRIAPLYYAFLLFSIGVIIYNHYELSWRSLLLDIFFLFNFSPQDIDGMVAASWSIGVEMIFYLLLPLILLLTRTLPALLAGLVLTVILGTQFEIGASAIDPQTGSEIWHSLFYNLPYFMLGLLAWRIYGFFHARADRLGKWNVALATGFVIAGFGVIVLLQYWSPVFFPYVMREHIRIIYDVVWGIGLATICLGMAIAPLPVIAGRAMQFLGRISFSLYLCHPHLINFGHKLGMYDWLLTHLDRNSAAFLFSSLGLTIAILTPIAYALYRLIEVPGMALGRRLQQKHFPA